MTHERNIANWFELPVKNMERAIEFYESVFELKLEQQKHGPLLMALFPMVQGGSGAGGALVYNIEFYKPSLEGIVIYLDCPSGDVQNELSRVEQSGGTILVPKKQISEEYGFMAIILDTEGNRVGLHSMK